MANLVWVSVCSVLLYDSLLTCEYPFYLALGFPLKSFLLFNKLRQPETSVELITYCNLLTLPVNQVFYPHQIESLHVCESLLN